MAETKAVAVKASALEAAAAKIDEIASGAMEIFSGGSSGFAKELGVALAVGQMRALLTPEVMKPVMDLMNTDIGFRTDRDPKVTPQDKNGHPMVPYGVDTVRECFIEARLRGFSLVGNEFNIISGRCYGALNGFARKCRTFQGVSNLKIDFGVPKLAGDRGAIVACSASWKIGGQEDKLSAEIPIRVNSFMGADAILGKAARKLYKRVFERMSGANVPDGEAGEDGPVVDAGTGALSGDEPKADFGAMKRAAEAAPEPAKTPPVETDGVPMDDKPSPAPPAASAAPAEPEKGPEGGTDGELLQETPQDKLAAFVMGLRYSFDSFRKWAVLSGNAQEKEVDSWVSFDEVPDKIANLVLRSQTGFRNQMKAVVKPSA